MNSIPKISVETKFNNLYNQNQSTYMSSTSPAFKGAGDKFVKEAAGKQRGKISVAIAALLASVGIIKKSATETETVPAVAEETAEQSAPVVYETWEELLDAAEKAAKEEFEQAKAEPEGKYKDEITELEEKNKALDEERKAAYAKYEKVISDARAKRDAAKSAAYDEWNAVRNKAYNECEAARDKAYNEWNAVCNKAYNECEAAENEAYMEWELAVADMRASTEEYAKATAVKNEKYRAARAKKQEIYSKADEEKNEKYRAAETKKLEIYSKADEVKKRKYAQADAEYASEIAGADEEYRRLDKEISKNKSRISELKKQQSEEIKLAKAECDNAIQEAKLKFDIVIKELKELRKTKTGEVIPPMTAVQGLKYAKASIKQKAKEKAAKQAELDKIAAKKAAKLADLEKMGITDVEETDEKTIRFVYQGIAYILKNETADNVNLLRLVKKVVRDDPTVGEYTIKAIRGSEECDCDWGIGEAAHVTEALCQMLEADTELMASSYYTALFEEYVKYMNSAELNEFIDKHTAIALCTRNGAKYIESLKTSNPARYIKIITPEKLYETEEGKAYLKTYAPEKFEELNQKTLEIRIKARVEEELDKLLPPASTVSVEWYRSYVTREAKYLEGHYEYESGTTGTPISSSAYWVPGRYEKKQTHGGLKYQYNGEEHWKDGDNTSREELLEEVYAEIEQQRNRVRAALEKIIRRNFAKGREDAPIIEVLGFESIYEPGYEDEERGHKFWKAAQTRVVLTFKFDGKTYEITRYDRSKEELIETARKQVLAEILYETVAHHPIAIDDDYMDE